MDGVSLKSNEAHLGHGGGLAVLDDRNRRDYVPGPELAKLLQPGASEEQVAPYLPLIAVNTVVADNTALHGGGGGLYWEAGVHAPIWSGTLLWPADTKPPLTAPVWPSAFNVTFYPAGGINGEAFGALATWFHNNAALYGSSFATEGKYVELLNQEALLSKYHGPSENLDPIPTVALKDVYGTTVLVHGCFGRGITVCARHAARDVPRSQARRVNASIWHLPAAL